MIGILSLLFVFFVAADLISKTLAVQALVNIGNSMEFLPGLIRFEYHQNTGMAWGLLPDSRWLFIPLTVVVAVFICWLVFKYRRTMPVLMMVSLMLILSGAIGNLVDRIFLGYVRDFIAFDFMDFPVFNIADTCVTIGGILLGVTILFTKSGRKFFALFDSDDKKKKTEAASCIDDGAAAEKTDE